MQLEQFLMLDIQRKALDRMCEEVFVYSGPEEARSASESQEPTIPLKPRHSRAALLFWWLGCRLVKTGHRFLQYAD